MTYGDICSYFPKYSNPIIAKYYTKKNIKFSLGSNYQKLGDDDNHLIEEYQWFTEFQAMCDQVNEIISFTCKIQQQQSKIIHYIEQVNHFTKNVQNGIAIEKDAKEIYLSEFKKIKWLTCLNEGRFGYTVYKYSQSLYIQVSKIKTDFISTCQKAFFVNNK